MIGVQWSSAASPRQSTQLPEQGGSTTATVWIKDSYVEVQIGVSYGDGCITYDYIGRHDRLAREQAFLVQTYCRERL
jgi:hypothetical protein